MKVAFFWNGAVAEGQYLLGHYAFERGVTVTGARLRGRRPAAADLVLELEADGAGTGLELRLAAGTGEGEAVAAGSVAVAAGAELRWRATGYAGAETEAATGLEVETELGEDPGFATGEEALEVWWVFGSERKKLFDYDAGSRMFTESESGVSSGKSIFTNVGPDASFTISILGTLVFTADASGVLRAGFLSGEPPAQGVARVEFWRADGTGLRTRLGWVSGDGGVGGDGFTEGTPGTDGFVFYGGGSAGVSLGDGGWTARGGFVAEG